MTSTFSIVNLKEIKLASMSIHTDMSKAMNDCSALWQEFVLMMQGDKSFIGSTLKEP